MRRLTWLIVGPSIAAVVAALAAMPFLPAAKPLDEDAVLRSFTIDARSLFSLGTFWGWYQHMLLGAAIVSSIVLILRSRDTPAKRVFSFVAALILGGAFGAGGDALSDFLCLSVARSISPDYKISIFRLGSVDLMAMLWPFWFSLGICMAIAIALGADQTTLKRAGLGVVFGTFFASIARYAADTIQELVVTVKALTANGTTVPTLQWSIPRLLAIDIFMAIAIGIAFYLVNVIIRDRGLKGLNGAIAGRFWGLGDAPARIGTAYNCQVCLPKDGSVSDIHAQVQCNSGEHFITSVNSPLVVNGANVAQSWLSDGDVVTIGNYRLAYGSANLTLESEASKEYALLDEMGRRTELTAVRIDLANATFERTPTGMTVVDDTGAGLRVNGETVQSAQLKPGDTIKVEGETYRLVVGGTRK